ncbi:hypothetical protein OXX79_001701 [Metschnikowia pulcherrima]|uniref:Uncharacterized protein n=1 Tax=Metschnikowia pulcherrima TaxID=27326 RepID=A0A8H7GKK0_9ASCO|nr:hypothetical protein HF325_006697 [Metschnikowia pulcherrima]KAJ8140517.1 hypothetical protein OY671_006294 [Metschnikowia pulcherrima]
MLSLSESDLAHKNTNRRRKKSVLLPMLAMMSLYPLLTQYNRLFNANLNIVLTLRYLLLRVLLLVKYLTNI